jgi:2-phosphoglycerate kinase
MIYLIGWSPRCGKSTVARTLSKKLGLSYISTDYLASAMQSKLGKEESISLLWEKRSDPNNRKNNEVRFATFSNHEQLTVYHQRASWCWSCIRNIITYMLDDSVDYIIEWFHLRPSIIIDDLQRWWNAVRYLSLYKSDVQEIEHGIRINQQPNDWAQIHTHEDATYSKIASFIDDFGALIKNESEEYWLDSFDMSAWDFQDNVHSVVQQLTS